MRVALDTNILAYAEGLGDEQRCALAIQCIEYLPGADVLIPAQAMGELSRVLTAMPGVLHFRHVRRYWPGRMPLRWQTLHGLPFRRRWI